MFESPTPLRSTETPIAVQSLFADGVLRVSVKPGEHTLAHARANIDAVRMLAAGKRVRVLLDFRAASSGPDSDAQKFYMSPEVLAGMSAMAVLSSGVLSRMMANMLLAVMGNLKTHGVAARAFSSEADAWDWLASAALRPTG